MKIIKEPTKSIKIYVNKTESQNIDQYVFEHRAGRIDIGQLSAIQRLGQLANNFFTGGNADIGHQQRRLQLFQQCIVNDLGAEKQIRQTLATAR